MTPPRNVSRFAALIIEGIPGVGKSTLIDALTRRHVDAVGHRKIRSFLHLAQTHTYGPLASAEDAATLTAEANRDHLTRITEILEWLHAGVQNPKHPPCFVLIDTLHLTHCVRPGIITWANALDVDNRLAAIGVKLVVLHARPETVWDRLILVRNQTQFLREYCAKFGQTNPELHSYFMHEQERFIEMFEHSSMRKATLSNDGETNDIVDRAFTFWVDE